MCQNLILMHPLLVCCGLKIKTVNLQQNKNEMEPKRHAYCIIAHDRPHQLARLVEMIDDPRNDIFIMVDGKADLKPFEIQVRARQSKVRFATKRPEIYWGHFSMVEAILLLVEQALKDTKPSRVHLLSGADLPLMTQDAIHRLCDDLYPEDEFIDVSADPEDLLQAGERAAHRYRLLRYARPDKSVGHLAFSIVRRLTEVLPRRMTTKKIYKGSMWWSLTRSAAKLILSRRDEIRHLFGHALVADELFAQTILMDSEFASKIHPRGDLRAIDWIRGMPHVWTEEEINELLGSGAMFGRKFDMDRNPVLIEKISRICTPE